MTSKAGFCVLLLAATGQLRAQTEVALQPLAQQVRRLEDALNYLGQPFTAQVHQELNQAMSLANEREAVARIQKILDPYVLLVVNINAESRVKVSQGDAKPSLVEGGTRHFLVKGENEAGVTAPLRAESPNSGPTSLQSQGEPEPKLELTPEDAKERWANIEVYNKPPMGRRLSGLPVEYQILEIYSRDRGQRSAKIAFNVGQGTQDIGFRNDILVLFNSEPAREITLRVKNHKNEPAFASFVIKDRLQRIYPNPSKRLAPDFPFQPQIYRYDGETIRLPDGYYTRESEREAARKAYDHAREVYRKLAAESVQ